MANAISNRKFGVEVEFVGAEAEDVANAMRVAGIACNHENYNHETKATWKIVYDQSVYGGWELVSPPLSSVAGLHEMQKALDILKGCGARVNESCGLHVHIDAADLTAGDMCVVLNRYAQYEEKLDGVMSDNRRSDNNSYCRSLKHISRCYPQYTNQTSPRGLANYIDNRYYKVNISSFNRHGTIEFRQHNGTVDSMEVTNWVLFCLNLVETSKGQKAKATVKASQPVIRRGRALGERAMLTLHRLIEGCQGNGSTLAELAVATGLEERTIETYMQGRLMQIGYMFYKTNDVYKVRARPNAIKFSVETAVDSTTADPFIGLDKEVVDYYVVRAQRNGYTFA